MGSVLSLRRLMALPLLAFSISLSVLCVPQTASAFTLVELEVILGFFGKKSHSYDTDVTVIADRGGERLAITGKDGAPLTGSLVFRNENGTTDVSLQLLQQHSLIEVRDGGFTADGRPIVGDSLLESGELFAASLFVDDAIRGSFQPVAVETDAYAFQSSTVLYGSQLEGGVKYSRPGESILPFADTGISLFSGAATSTFGPLSFLFSEHSIRFWTAGTGLLGEEFQLEFIVSGLRPSDPTSIPEPGSMLLLGSGVAGMLLARRKKAVV